MSAASSESANETLPRASPTRLHVLAKCGSPHIVNRGAIWQILCYGFVMVQSQAKDPTLKRTLRTPIVITALALTFGLGTTPAWAEETQDANTQPTSASYY